MVLNQLLKRMDSARQKNRITKRTNEFVIKPILCFSWIVHSVHNGRLFPKKGKNPMTSRNIAPILYATGSIYIGLGSFAMHGSNTAIGGILDWSGMLFFISFPVFYNLFRIILGQKISY